MNTQTGWRRWLGVALACAYSVAALRAAAQQRAPAKPTPQPATLPAASAAPANPAPAKTSAAPAPAKASAAPAPAKSSGSAPASAGTAPPAVTAPAPEADIPPPPPSYESAPAEPAASGGEQAAAAACIPACRSGYTCIEGQCVSACNPPCGPGEQCTSAGECVLPHAPPPSAQRGRAGLSSLEHGARRHDGFMLRLGLALGAATLVEDPSGDLLNAIGRDSGRTDYTGFAAGLAVDIGGALAENLVLHGRLALFQIPDPSVTDAGDELGTGQHISVVVPLLGPAVTYYFMPINLYVTGAVGWSSVTFNYKDSQGDQNADYTTDSGFGLNLDVGKEWWVGDDWGLGVAGRFWYSGLTDEPPNSDQKAEYSFIGWALMFSATYQ